MKLTNITKIYNNKKVLDDIDFSFENSNIVGLIGKNGVGKTTLMKIMTGNLTNYQGQVFRNCRIGYSIEEPKLYQNKSGYENIKIFSYILTGELDKNYLSMLLESFDMTNYINKKVKKYSMGMKQKLSIVLALINKPQILILDEPTNGMDPDGSVNILNKIKELSNKFDIRILISSHKLEDIEMICTRALFLKDGKFVENIDMTSQKGSWTVIKTHSSDFDSAKNTLENIFQIEESSNENNSIFITYTEDHSEIIKVLAQVNIFPTSIYNETKTLRNTYFNINKGGSNEHSLYSDIRY
ncbi:phenol-soluble modulin export ABC transporter ATP-binding protein PmtC [Staphylococcus pasteuri]|uniref:phenol-soluble modulin export ABC transporter ATP-binding protein PmtC n=1 Tax=Staphylococcus pasteuri TaxID=45972 RepID=UPI002DBE224C|nr:ABC transporter ATP-binding protein [Staphylococcus pasteuri]MEB6613499.1 ABC transporter ATP-binding protein [Staphylococcus pasteuri]